MVPHLKIEEGIDEILQSRSCVTGIPDDQRGERLAVLYTKAEVTPGELWGRLADTDLPRLWIPKRENIYQVESIPVLGSGKLDLRGAKAMAIELSTAATLEVPVGAGKGQDDAN
jgi:acyl-[acyl-carrier-protein]-phospholipid O-acyltransferase/long-chain-fatty-acid--[acyl-carrier-protein] ligase